LHRIRRVEQKAKENREQAKTTPRSWEKGNKRETLFHFREKRRELLVVIKERGDYDIQTYSRKKHSPSRRRGGKKRTFFCRLEGKEIAWGLKGTLLWPCEKEEASIERKKTAPHHQRPSLRGEKEGRGAIRERKRGGHESPRRGSLATPRGKGGERLTEMREKGNQV